MHPQTLLHLTLSLTSAVTFVCGAPSNTADINQAVTIQHLFLGQDGQTQSDTVNKLTQAMSDLRGGSGGKLAHSYVGVVKGNPNVIEQIFLWNSLADVPDDVTKPFLPFSDNGAVNSSTALFANRTILLNTLNYPIIETVVLDILPEISASQVEEDYQVVIQSVSKTGSAIGGSHGYDFGGDRRTFMAISGWKSREAVNEWLNGQDEETTTVYNRLIHSFVGGVGTAFYKHIVEKFLGNMYRDSSLWNMSVDEKTVVHAAIALGLIPTIESFKKLTLGVIRTRASGPQNGTIPQAGNPALLIIKVTLEANDCEGIVTGDLVDNEKQSQLLLFGEDNLLYYRIYHWFDFLGI
ncbi:hypothetical protein L218DRAFT_944289 [Marasmius fiardii PR-910]|nr:hypothetical protein L218DRAFT_944289 [Marasmius fiardii PR-910]